LAYFQLHTFPNLPTVGVRSIYDLVPWSKDMKTLRAWQCGRTGFPLIDAGMRELWNTGWMQQNVRNAVASFLIEYLGHDWRCGMRWFHDTLVDSDVAINSMMWQNSGRSGVDQWNFVVPPDQGLKKDPQGEYVKRWVPELKDLPLHVVFCPWKASEWDLRRAGVELGKTYPHPIVFSLKKAHEQIRRSVVDTRAKFGAHNMCDYDDTIELPNGRVTRVYTRRELREDWNEFEKQLIRQQRRHH